MAAGEPVAERADLITPLLPTQALLADRYRLEREIGRGGMAVVYLATDVARDRQVAVKVLLEDLSVALGPERFRREIQFAAQLEHPHILPISDSGEAGGLLYFVMPYVAGETLHGRLDRERQLPVDEAVRLTCQVADALEYAHARGIIHRDIKPENILLENGHARVADFGIARAIRGADADKLTKTGVTLGTPTYMSPEQATAERDLDGRSDVYSLGCVLYEMLAGQPPFVGRTAAAIIARHTLDEVPSLTIVRGTIPDEVEDVVMRALAKVPADRFKSAAEFSAALRDSLQPKARPFWRRRRWMARRRAGGRAGRARSAPRMVGAAVVASVGLGLAVQGLVAARHGTAAAPAAAAAGADAGLPPERLAVLYFDDLSSDHSLGHLADGLTEELIADLAGVQGIDVVSRNGVAGFRGGEIPPDSVARALGAGTLVSGSIERAGTRLRVAVRLIDGGSGADFKRASFDYSDQAFLAARDTVVRQVATFLRERLGDEIRLRESKRGTNTVDAWTLAQRAERGAKEAAARARANDTVAAWRQLTLADSLLARAAELDPRWADPVVRRGRVARRRALLSADQVGRARWTGVGIEHAERALQLSPKSADALELRGTLRYDRWARHLVTDPREAAVLLGQAEADLKQAVSLAPSLASAWSTLALVYYQKPDLIEATLAARRAYEADAYLSNASTILWQLYTTSYDNERFLDAVHWCDEGRRRFPDNSLFVRCQLWLMTTNAREPNAAEGWRLVEELRKRTPDREWAYAGREARMLVGAALGRAGLLDSADRVLTGARADAKDDPEGELLSIEAFIRDLIGQREEALRLLKMYLIGKPEHRPGFAVSQSWWWRDIKKDPRFRELVGGSR